MGYFQPGIGQSTNQTLHPHGTALPGSKSTLEAEGKGGVEGSQAVLGLAWGSGASCVALVIDFTQLHGLCPAPRLPPELHRGSCAKGATGHAPEEGGERLRALQRVGVLVDVGTGI